MSLDKGKSAHDKISGGGKKQAVKNLPETGKREVRIHPHVPRCFSVGKIEQDCRQVNMALHGR
jgi:hypothetical protein